MKTIFSIIILILLAGMAFSQTPTIAWEKRLPSYTGTTIVADSNGGFVIACYLQSVTSVTHLTASGDTIWNFVVSPLYSLDLLHTPDDGYLLAGTEGEDQLTLIKLSSAGGLEWSHNYGTDGYMCGFRAMAQTADNGILIVGSSWSCWPNSTLIRCTAQGDTLWTRQIAIAAEDSLCAILPFADGSFLLVGSSYGVFLPPGLFLMKCDTQGDSLWLRSYDHLFYAHDAKLFLDNIYIVGRIDGWDMLGLGIMKTDTSGNILGLHHENFGNGGFANLIRLAAGNKLLVSGAVSPFDAADVYYVAEYDTARHRLWELTSAFDMTLDLTRQAVEGVPLAGGGYVFITDEYRERTNSQVLLITKLCPEGSSTGYVNVIKNNASSGGYRLSCSGGSLDTLIFPGVSAGTTGWVGGAAAAHWSVLANGDGNNGDSLVFVSTVPLAVGSLDTFWVSRPTSPCFCEWTAGCISGTSEIWNGQFDSLRFSGTSLGASNVQLSLEVYGERNILNYELWGFHADHFELIHRAFVPDDSAQHVYVYNDFGGHTQWYFAAVSHGGCLQEFRDHMLNVSTIPVSDPVVSTVTSHSLSAFPNPFNPGTSIVFALPQTGKARLAVYNIVGREMRVLHEGITEAGEHRFAFDGAGLPSGIYFARLESAGLVKTQKLLLLK